MLLNRLFLQSGFSNGSFTKNTVVPVVRLEHAPSYRFHEVGALRNFSQRRIIFRGAGIEQAELTCELSPALLEDLFGCISTRTVSNNKATYTLTNSSAIPSSQRCGLIYETFEGRRVQTSWGVLYELRLNLVATEIPSATARFVFVGASTTPSSVPTVSQTPSLLTPQQLSGIIVVGTNQRTVLINSLQLTYQRKLEPKTSVLGYLVDVYQAEQVVSFELGLVDSSFSQVGDILSQGLRARLVVQIANLYQLIVPEFVIESITSLYDAKIFRISCFSIGDSNSQIQLSQL